MDMPQLSKNDMRRVDDSCYGFLRGNAEWQAKNTGRDQREMCQYCKNDNTDRVVDQVYLTPFAEYHGGKSFVVMHCFCCNAVWHWSKQ